MMAASNNVQTYAAAQVFYWVGFNGIAYVLDVFIADTSSLKWRGLMFAFSTSPYIATAFAGPAAANSFYVHSTWRWAYGTFAIVTPVMCAPFLWVFWHNQRLAKKQGILVDKREASGRTWYQSLKHYAIEFDRKCASYDEHRKYSNKPRSRRHDSHHRWMVSSTPTVQPGHLPSIEMEVRLDNHHDRCRLLSPRLLRNLGTLLRSEAILALPLPHRPNSYWVLPLRRHALHQLLLLGSLLPVLPSGSVQLEP